MHEASGTDKIGAMISAEPSPKDKMVRFAILAVVLCTGLGMSLKWAPMPFIWISLCLLALTLAAGRSLGRRNVLVGLELIFLTLAAMESSLWILRQLPGNEPDPTRVVYGDDYMIPDELLGYAPIKAKRVAGAKLLGDSLLYEATYTIDESGLRLSSAQERVGGRCVLFFGGSFVFGEGVNDDEALPAVVAAESDFRVFNYGFHGYGAHQMLARLQAGPVAERTHDCGRVAVVYVAIADHVSRAAGKAVWDSIGPRYSQDADGHAVLAGRFNDRSAEDNSWRSWLSTKISNQFHKSLVLERLDQALEVSRDTDLFGSIVMASAIESRRMWPTSSFHVVFWDFEGTRREAKAIRSLRDREIRLHLVSDIIPDLRENPGGYEIHTPYDRHPNALAHERVARYVLSFLNSES